MYSALWHMVVIRTSQHMCRLLSTAHTCSSQNHLVIQSTATYNNNVGERSSFQMVSTRFLVKSQFVNWKYQKIWIFLVLTSSQGAGLGHHFVCSLEIDQRTRVPCFNTDTVFSDFKVDVHLKPRSSEALTNLEASRRNSSSNNVKKRTKERAHSVENVRI